MASKFRTALDGYREQRLETRMTVRFQTFDYALILAT